MAGVPEGLIMEKEATVVRCRVWPLDWTGGVRLIADHSLSYDFRRTKCYGTTHSLLCADLCKVSKLVAGLLPLGRRNAGMTKVGK